MGFLPLVLALLLFLSPISIKAAPHRNFNTSTRIRYTDVTPRYLFIIIGTAGSGKSTVFEKALQLYDVEQDQVERIDMDDVVQELISDALKRQDTSPLLKQRLQKYMRQKMLLGQIIHHSVVSTPAHELRDYSFMRGDLPTYRFDLSEEPTGILDTFATKSRALYESIASDLGASKERMNRIRECLRDFKSRPKKACVFEGVMGTEGSYQRVVDLIEEAYRISEQSGFADTMPIQPVIVFPLTNNPNINRRRAITRAQYDPQHPPTKMNDFTDVGRLPGNVQWFDDMYYSVQKYWKKLETKKFTESQKLVDMLQFLNANNQPIRVLNWRQCTYFKQDKYSNCHNYHDSQPL